jgi:molecular chaperone DnaJ
VQPDARFERRGDDLVTRLDVPFTQAALGATMGVETLEGEEELELEPGSQPGTIKRLRGHGLPGLRRRGRGDLHVLLNVMIPSHLTDEQRELLRQFEDSANGETYAKHGEGLFDRIRQAFRG